MFGRGKSGKNADEVAEAVIDNESRDHDEAVASDASAVVSASGPRDISEVGPDDNRIDLGALQVTGVPGLSLQVTVDETTKQVTMVTLVVEDAAVQVQAFAAPKTTGIWDDVRGKIMASVTDGGGLVEEVQGVFGTELRARVAGQNGAMQPARFVGIDGPRWFIRGLFLGSAATPAGHETLTKVFGDLVVVRGDEAMAPGDPLPMSVPTTDPAANATADPIVEPDS